MTFKQLKDFLEKYNLDPERKVCFYNGDQALEIEIAVVYTTNEVIFVVAMDEADG
jgi:hypothetical protein